MTKMHTTIFEIFLLNFLFIYIGHACFVYEFTIYLTIPESGSLAQKSIPFH
jgi:hypothetical protein